MNVAIYGNNATCPEADGACSCFLLKAGGKRILLDMGNGSLAKLQKDIDLAQLDMIVISHFHFDHFGDLFCAKYQLETRKAYGESISPVCLLAPRMPDWIRAELLGNDMFEYHEIMPEAGFRFDTVELNFVPMEHLVETYGVRVSSEGKVFAYSGDSGRCVALDELAYNADMLLCEATMLSGMAAEEGHLLCAAAAAGIAANNGVKQLLLTHFHSRLAGPILEEAKSVFPKVQVTAIGANYEI